MAVAGTHGKTTTTVMITEALAAARRNPTGLAGGRVAQWGGKRRIGGHDLFVVEADEFDRAFPVAHADGRGDHQRGGGPSRVLWVVGGARAGVRRVRRTGDARDRGVDDAGALRVAAGLKVPVWRVGLAEDADFRIRAVALGAQRVERAGAVAGRRGADAPAPRGRAPQRAQCGGRARGDPRAAGGSCRCTDGAGTSSPAWRGASSGSERQAE